MTKIVTFLHNESGSNAIEYSLIAALLGVAIIGVLSTLSTEVGTLFDTLSNDL